MMNMLLMLKYRGPDSCGIATSRGGTTAPSLDALDISDLSDYMALGHDGLLITRDQFIPQPLTNPEKSSFLALDGEIYNVKDATELNLSSEEIDTFPSSKLLFHLIERHSNNLLTGLSDILPKIYGDYAFAVMEKNQIFIASDVMGVKPLYWSENENYIAFASEKKPLWNLGLTNVSTFQPGNLAIINNKGIFLHKVQSLLHPEIIDVSLDEAVVKLRELLFLSLRRRLNRLKVSPIAVSFSGGLDSSLVAKALDMLGKKVILYSVGLDEAHDLQAAEYAASELNLPLRVRVLSPEEIEGYMSKVIYAIEDVDLMKTGVGIPFYAACELVNKDKMRVILTGQGSDELFAGYDKYLRVLINQGYDRLQNELWMDLTQMHEINLQRDDSIAMANGVELGCPFLDLDLVNAAMSINPRLKIAGPTDLLRKRVLREVAKSLGLSQLIVDKPKKSIQYGSGSEKAMRQLSKSKGFKDPRKFINSVFKQIFTPNSI